MNSDDAVLKATIVGRTYRNGDIKIDVPGRNKGPVQPNSPIPTSKRLLLNILSHTAVKSVAEIPGVS